LISASVVGILGSVASFAVTIALTGFEVLIQALQAYIFTLLTAVYISGALKAEH
jgi:F-type H+-transporting ATPase subunit a